MSPLRYKTLLTYLPGMASVVNSFDSPHVQAAVYTTLMEALDTKLNTEGLGRDIASEPLVASSSELTHELIEGESIHADAVRHQLRVPATVF